MTFKHKFKLGGTVPPRTKNPFYYLSGSIASNQKRRAQPHKKTLRGKPLKKAH